MRPPTTVAGAFAALCLAGLAPHATAQPVTKLEAGACPQPGAHPQVWFNVDPIYAASAQKRDLLAADGASIPGAIKDNGVYVTTSEAKMPVADSQVSGRIQINGKTSDPQTRQPYLALPAGTLILDAREWANPVDLHAGLIQCNGTQTRAVVITNIVYFNATAATSKWPDREKRVEAVAKGLYGESATALEFVSRSYLSPTQNAAWDAFEHPAAAAAPPASAAASNP